MVSNTNILNFINLCSGYLKFGLHVMELRYIELHNIEYLKVEIPKTPRHADSKSDTGRLVKDDPLQELKSFILACESCMEGKMTKRPFSSKGKRAMEPLELIHTNVYELFLVKAHVGYKYAMSSIDNYPRYEYLYSMKAKSKAFWKFLEYLAEVEKLLSEKAKCIWSNRGGEYLSEELTNYTAENGIRY